MVDLFLTGEVDLVATPQILALCAEAQQHVLIDERAVLAEVVFLHAVDLGGEHKERVASAENGAWVRLGELDAHFLVAPHKNLSRLRRGVFHHLGVLDVLNIGGEAAKVRRGFIHFFQDAVGGPMLGVLRSLKGASNKNEGGENTDTEGSNQK